MAFGDIDWGMIASGMPTPGMDDPMGQLQRRWPTPGMTAETMPTMPSSPISPEALAAHAAARGIPPPPVDLQPQNTNVGAALTGTGLPGDTPYRMPDQAAVTDWRNGVDQDMTRTPGAPAAPVTASGSPNPNAAPSGNTEVSASKKTGDKDKTPSFTDALKGVKMPAGPELQKLGTPAAPKPTNQIKGGDLIAMLQALGAGGAAAGGGMSLPSTLGQALLGRK